MPSGWLDSFTNGISSLTRSARQRIENGTRRLRSVAATAHSRAAAAAASARSRAAAAAASAHTHAYALKHGVKGHLTAAKDHVVNTYHHYSKDVRDKLHALKVSLGNLNMAVVGEYLSTNVIGTENIEAFKEILRKLKLIRDVILLIMDKNFEGFLLKYTNARTNHGTDINWLMQNISSLIFPLYLFPNFMLTTIMESIGSNMDKYGVVLLKAT